MPFQLSQAAQNISPSFTLALNAKANALKAEGRPIINLTIGEPDFDTPVHIKAAAIKAIQDGKTKYTPIDGIPSLKTAIIEKFERDNRLSYQKNQILVSCGGKQAIYNCCRTILNPGDEVIIPAPYWVSYPEIVKLTGAVPVIIPTTIEQHYKITPEQLVNAISSKTKLLIINSPSNPSGMVYTEQELKKLAEILLSRPNIFIMADDMYESIVWNHTPFNNMLMVCPELTDRTIITHGVSKTYAMTGWRIGYAAGPAPIIQAMANIQSQSTANPCSISQHAAEAALRDDQICVREMVAAFKARHDVLIPLLKAIPGIRVIPSDGTFYTFPDFSTIISSHGFKDDLDLAAFLLENAEVAVVPGSAFGLKGALRFSFATHQENLLTAANRLCDVLR
ncbi:MAG: aspartate aminotransferase [Gammaproteobacteria bacterium GWF2_41_13]|nr:MAG: aspartate aminotransferase [Gammaproteobacteria bacterium GWF2_41_13]